MSSDRINLKTVRLPARRKKKTGAFLNRRDIENSHALYITNIQWSRKQAYNFNKKMKKKNSSISWRMRVSACVERELDVGRQPIERVCAYK